jgi:flagellar motor switch protein FliN/FliY
MAAAKNGARWLADELSTRWAQALEGMTGEKPTVQWTPLAGPPAADVEWWEQAMSFPPGALIYAGATSANSTKLGEKVLEAAGVEASPEDAKGTYLETLNQALSGLGQALTARLRKEVVCTTGKNCSGPDPKATIPAVIKITLAGQSPIELMASFHPTLISALEPEEKQTKQAAAGATSATATAPAPVAAPPPTAAAPVAPTRTMELLYDVELPVSVSFGRAQLPLKDVIKLTSGSIVELNRSVTEPVEIIVNNCVIARGEVVVIEGNYGVRIDQIISRQERLRTLK